MKARRVEIARKAGLASAAKKCEAESFAIAPLPALVAALKWLEKHREELRHEV